MLKSVELLNVSFALNNTETLNHILNCSSAILSLSLKNCDLKNNPNPKVSSRNYITSNINVSVIVSALTLE